MGPSLESNGMIELRDKISQIETASMGPSLESNGMEGSGLDLDRGVLASMGPSLESNGMYTQLPNSSFGVWLLQWGRRSKATEWF